MTTTATHIGGGIALPPSLSERHSTLPGNVEVANMGAHELASHVRRLVATAEKMPGGDAMDCNRFLAAAALRFAEHFPAN